MDFILLAAAVINPQIILLPGLLKSRFNAHCFVEIILQLMVAIIYPHHLYVLHLYIYT